MDTNKYQRCAGDTLCFWATFNEDFLVRGGGSCRFCTRPRGWGRLGRGRSRTASHERVVNAMHLFYGYESSPFHPSLKTQLFLLTAISSDIFNNLLKDFITPIGNHL